MSRRVVEKRICAQSGEEFTVSEKELRFLEKVSPRIAGKSYLIPPSEFSPRTRELQRLSFRNERSLYRRNCSATGKSLISIYPEDAPYPVFDQSYWWCDQYDPLAYGKNYDFSRTFFEQFAELFSTVPKAAIHNAKSENCDYTNYSAENKNCYLVVGGLGAEDCYYSYRVFYSRDIADCYDLYKCELCYECLQSTNLFNCIGAQNCHSGSDLVLCENCIGCRNCFGCVNLRNEQWRIFNKPCSPEEFKRIVELSFSKPEEILPQYIVLKEEQAPPSEYLRNCECCSGEQLLNCKNCDYCFTLKNSEDCAYSAIGENNRDCFDSSFFDNCELQYFSANNEKNYHVIFASLVWYSSESAYLMNCFNSSHLFGCTGMKKHKYCVLNKPYLQSEYESLVPRIIDQMHETGEWGRYFPPEVSPFAYDETVAQEWYPLERGSAQELGYFWRETSRETKQVEEYTIPENIKNVSDDILGKTLRCETSGELYRIIPQELAFYRKLGLPIPLKSPAQRHRERMEEVRINC